MMWMCVAVVTAMTCQEVPGAGSSGNRWSQDPGRDQVLEDLAVLERLLAKSLAEQAKEIAGPSEGVSFFTPNTPRYLNGLTGGVALNTNGYSYFGGSARPDVRSDYLPGIGAVLSLDLSVRLELVEDEEEESDSKVDREADLWDQAKAEMEGGSTGFAWSKESEGVYMVDGQSLPNSQEKFEKLTYRYSVDALADLEHTLLRILADYGHRVDLPMGESLTVSVHLRPGRLVSAPSGGGSGAGVTVGALFQYTRDNASRWIVPGPRRLVVGLAMKDLVGYRDSRLDWRDVEDRARVHTF